LFPTLKACVLWLSFFNYFFFPLYLKFKVSKKLVNNDWLRDPLEIPASAEPQSWGLRLCSVQSVSSRHVGLKCGHAANIYLNCHSIEDTNDSGEFNLHTRDVRRVSRFSGFPIWNPPPPDFPAPVVPLHSCNHRCSLFVQLINIFNGQSL